MERSTWKGTISFGLVSIPIILYNSEDASEKVAFHQIDKRNHARIKYKRVNTENNKEVPWEEIGKAYQYDKETMIPVEEGELEKVAGDNIRSIAIETFINENEIHFINVEKTYYLMPDKKAGKGYVILREALKQSGKMGIGRVIMSSKEYIAAVATYENALVLYLLRYHHQIKPLSDFDFPSENLKDSKVTAKEIDIANQLIKSMSSKWKPEQYIDEYQKAVHQWAENKMKRKAIHKMLPRSTAPKQNDKAVDFVELLKQSLGAAKKSPRQRAAKVRSNLAALKRRQRTKSQQKKVVK